MKKRILTPRDLKAIETVYWSRCVIPAHLQHIFNSDLKGKPNKIGLTLARRRLKVYYQHHIIDRFFVDPGLYQGTSPQYVVLDRVGAMILAGWWGMGLKELKWRSEHNRIHPQRLAHTIGINDFRTWLIEIALKRKHTPGIWKVEHHNYIAFNFEGRDYRLEPDAYGQYWYSNKQGLHFYYEHDRGTMGQIQWKDKLIRYQAHYKSSVQRQTYPAVLCTTTSWSRAKDLASLAGQYNPPWLFSCHREGFTDQWLTQDHQKVELFSKNP